MIRKLCSGSGLGLGGRFGGVRLSRRFVFLILLSALVTVCFGAIFFLPDSVRLRRFFLLPSEPQRTDSAGSGLGLAVGAGSGAAAGSRYKQTGTHVGPVRRRQNDRFVKESVSAQIRQEVTEREHSLRDSENGVEVLDASNIRYQPLLEEGTELADQDVRSHREKVKE
eukprot:g29235.t1